MEARDPAAVLVNKTWKLFRASPMFNLSLQRASLDHYADNLAVYVNAEILKNTTTPTDEDDDEAQVVKLTTATFIVLPNFSLEKDEPEALMLSISYQSKGRGAATGEPRNTTFTAVLCSVGNPQVIGRNRTRAMSHRPLVFTKGPLRLTQLVNFWFESNFDCRIFPFRLLPVELSLMAAQFSSAISDADDDLLSKPFEFVYGFPDTIQELSQLTLTIPTETMKALAKSVVQGSEKKPKENDAATEIEQGKVLLKAIEDHFRHFFHINLASLKLLRLGTPVCHIGGDGRIKFFSAALTLHVLQHLTSLAIAELSKVH